MSTKTPKLINTIMNLKLSPTSSDRFISGLVQKAIEQKETKEETIHDTFIRLYIEPMYHNNNKFYTEADASELNKLLSRLKFIYFYCSPANKQFAATLYSTVMHFEVIRQTPELTTDNFNRIKESDSTVDEEIYRNYVKLSYENDDLLQAKISYFNEALEAHFKEQLQHHVNAIKISLDNSNVEKTIYNLTSFGTFLQKHILVDSLETMEKRLTPYRYLFKDLELHDLNLLPIIADARYSVLASHEDDKETTIISNLIRIGSSCYIYLLPPQFDDKVEEEYPEDQAAVSKAEESILKLIDLQPTCRSFNKALQEYLYYQTQESEDVLIKESMDLYTRSKQFVKSGAGQKEIDEQQIADELSKAMEVSGGFAINPTKEKLEGIGKLAEKLKVSNKKEQSANGYNKVSTPLAIYYNRKIVSDKQGLISKEQDKINAAIYEIDKKAEDLRERGFLQESGTARKTSIRLQQKTNAYYAIASIKDRMVATPEYKNQCVKELKEADKELSIHRGWKQIAGNVLLAIAGVGIGYLIAGGVRKALTGKFWFFSQTDSKKKLAKTREAINNSKVAKAVNG